MFLSGLPETSQKYTISKIIDLQDPLGNIPLSKNKIQNTFAPTQMHYDYS